jgi:hypothetical protein
MRASTSQDAATEDLYREDAEIRSALARKNRPLALQKKGGRGRP